MAIALEVFLGVGAVGGGLALMAGPNGEILPVYLGLGVAISLLGVSWMRHSNE
jgi:hypothetical protein